MTNAQSKELIQVQLTSDEASLIADAARICSQTSSEFALGAALAKAQEAVLDQTLFILSDSEFSDLEKALSEPPVANPESTRLLNAKPHWATEPNTR